MSTQTCLHCGQRQGSRRGRLCKACFREPELRKRYPRLRLKTLVDHDRRSGLTLPDAPVYALPGSEQKLLALEERARLRLCLHHPLDGLPDAML